MTLRLRGSKTELEEMGEDVSDMATTTSQLQAKLLALTGGKVDIMLDENTFKNSTQILREMAAAWEDMNDIQRASALELMGGKRQANVLSALIQNFDTVEKAIEASAGSAGSALEENERYLDSIAGKIDQFNNAVQSLWQNLLGSDVIKWIIDWGTKIIKSLDTVEGKFLAIVKVVAILMAYKKVNPLDWVNDIGTFFAAVKSNGIKQYLLSLLGLAPAMKTVTAETVANTIATEVNDAAKTKAILSSAGLTGATGVLSAAQRQQAADAILTAVNTGTLSVAQGQAALATLGFATAVNTADGSLKILDTTTKSFMATNPIGWILAIVSVLITVIMWLSQIPSKVEKLNEKLKDLKSELSDIQSEIDSLNSELETTQSRMSELLSMDNLSFTEEEELEKLRRQNDELQREIDLQKTLQKSKQRETERVFKETMQGKMDQKFVKDNRYGLAGTATKEANWLDKILGSPTSGKNAWENNIAQYLDKVDYNKALQESAIKAQEVLDGEDASWFDRWIAKLEVSAYNDNSEMLGRLESSIGDKLEEYRTDIEGIEYGDDPEVNAYLDYVNNMLDRWAITMGEDNAKTKAISRIFNKDENSSISDSIDSYVEALKNGDISAKESIENIIENNKELVEDIEASGLFIGDAVDYFTSFASESNYATIDGKVKEIDEATKRLNTALNGLDASSLDSVKQALTDKGWVDTDGNLMSDVIAEYFGGEDGGISEKTKAEIERLVQQIYDGKISVEDALKQFEYFGIESTLDIYIAEVQTNFKDVFVELEDADGLIDTFKELGDAIGSTSDALKAFNKAEAEMANSGRVSIETALQLMEYTDNYGSVLEVVDGKLQLVDGAEEALIQTRIDAIKTSAEASLASAEAAYAKAQEATSMYRDALTTDMSAEVVAKSWEKVLAAGAGLMAGIKSLVTGETWTEAYNRAYNETLSNMTGYETSYDDAGLQALINAEEDAKKAVDEAQDRVNLANKLTSETLESINDADDADTKEDVANDAFQKEMDYWENRIAANQSKYEQIQNEIDLLESKGQKANAAYYQEQIGLENQRMHLLQGQKREAKEYLATLEEGSEEWWEVANTLNDIESEIDDVTASIVNLQDAIDEINVYKFDEFNSRLDNLMGKLGTIRDLIAPNGEEDWFDEEGNWTDSGIAVAGTYLQELETYKQGYQNTVDELAKYQEEYEGNEGWYASLGIHSEQEYYDKVESLVDQQYQYAESISDTEQSIVDMYESSIDAVEEYVDTLIDGYNDYIDSVKEALEAERDLYDFKKNVQKQAKDIAELERRIASLSGSTNKADIAERRKLEAQLYESRESLNDTYYDHAKDAQNEALDAEQQAYETAMTTMVEKMRLSLEEATTDMASFLDSVTIAVSMNADTVLEKYRETEVPLNDAITNPWEEAAEKVIKYGGNANNLMDVWKKDGYFAEFKSTAGTNLSSPWDSGTTAANAFKSSVYTVMSNVVSNISTNVKTASGELSKLYQQIQDTEKRAASANVAVGGGSSSSGYGSGSSGTSKSAVTTQKQLDNAILTKYKLTSSQVLALGYGPLSLSEFENLLKTYQIKYSAIYKQVANTRDIERLSKRVMYGEYVSGPLAVRQYAKGTMGTTYDEWAITDESWIGEEITLAAGKNGQLQYLKKGSAVMPADISANLVEWGKIDPNMLNAGVNPNINMISNAINKPEFNITFDALVKAENITEEMLPAVKKFVTQELNRFTKELNYALKSKGAR